MCKNLTARRRNALAFFLSLGFVIPNLCGCAHAAPPAPAPVAAVYTPAPMSIGGIAYDPSAPLEATVTPKFDTKNPPESSLTYAVRFKGAKGEVVPALLTLPPAKSAAPASSTDKTMASVSAPYPVVLLGHGINGKKEDLFLLAVALARAGYASMVLDTAGHGERPRIGGKAVLALSPDEFHTMCAQTIVDYRRATDYLKTRKDINGDKIGYIGVSLGGILGGVFVGDEPRVKTAVFWAAGGNWGRLLTTSQLGGKPGGTTAGASGASAAPTTAGVTAGKTAEALEKLMADVDPLYALPKAAGHPLLFINGDKDVIVPTPCTDELFAAVKEPKKRIVLPGGHIPDPFGMTAETIKFLNANLLP